MPTSGSIAEIPIKPEVPEKYVDVWAIGPDENGDSISLENNLGALKKHVNGNNSRSSFFGRKQNC